MMHRVLRLLPPERAHLTAVAALRVLPMPGLLRRTPVPALQTQLWGQRFASPIGMAAGFDKHGEAMSGLLDLGFGFVEVGSITPAPQPGNLQPRVFRAPANGAVINRYGFNSHGHAAVRARLSAWRQQRPTATLGINLGMNKGCEDPLEAYVAGIAAFEDLASYLVVNLSSPNTAGLRDQQTAGLRELIRALKAAQRRDVPLLLKVAPDLLPDQIALIAETSLAEGLDGLIVTNTTLARPETLPAAFRDQSGGLSGAPLTDGALAVLQQFYAHTKGQLPLIGAGGIMSGADAVARVRAGADLLQIYTGLLYRGVGLVREIERALIAAMAQEGVTNIGELKGT